MDTFLVDYLRSGKAWLLVGSGPSIEMGYPTSKSLAEGALALTKPTISHSDYTIIHTLFKQGDYPLVFEYAIKALGFPPVLAHLRNLLQPNRPARIYQILAKWPIPVYLTTNYDDEIQTQLATLGDAYVVHSNSVDHMNLLTSGRSGAIFKIHGDLKSEVGLILTKSQYQAVQENESWKYWRTKLTSVFQFNPVIVVGHSLSDPNIRQVLDAAKQGAGVDQPVCWIAPEVPPPQSREYLEKFRIRVIPYDNTDGSHSNLYRMIENIGRFVYPRVAVRIRREFRQAILSPLGRDAAAPGFFVYIKLLKLQNFEQARVAAICAAIQSVIPELRKLKTFTIEQAVQLAGWPTTAELALQFKNEISVFACESGLLTQTDDGLISLGPKADELAGEAKAEYSDLQERFHQSLVLRIRRNYQQLNDSQANAISEDIESSLVNFFREAGLSLATTLAAAEDHRNIPVPPSIIEYVNQAATRYDDLLRRQVFFTTAIDIFSEPEDADKEYLGRVSQGFFSLNALGLWGEAASEQLDNAKKTLWLIDSSAQIPALAITAPTSAVFRDAFTRLTAMGVRLFTTESLFEETREHYWFADRVIQDNGTTSPQIIAAALGQPPYPKANQFLEGFIRWQAAGNPSDWESYNKFAFGHTNPTKAHLRQALNKIGVEVIPLSNWPGYNPHDLEESAKISASIVHKWEDILNQQSTDPETITDFYKKAVPEAEALTIILNERQGRYHMISTPGQPSPAWFVSHTSMLNLLQNGSRITWQPEAFLRFGSTLSPSADTETAARAFDVLLLAFTEAGVSLLDQKTIIAAFGGEIDQAATSLETLSKDYEETLAWKYSEDPQSVLERVPPQYRPLAVLQIANEIGLVQERNKYAETIAAAIKRAEQAEKKAASLQRIDEKMTEKRRKRERHSRQIKSRKSAKKHKK